MWHPKEEKFVEVGKSGTDFLFKFFSIQKCNENVQKPLFPVQKCKLKKL